MKICIVSLGKTLNSQISPRFGRAPYLLILNEEGDLKEVLPNQAIGVMRGAGIAAAQEIALKKTEALITPNIGPNAFDVLMGAGIRVFSAPFDSTIKEVFLMWKNNKLAQAKIPAGPGGFGGRGFGPDRRRHRGRHRRRGR